MVTQPNMLTLVTIACLMVGSAHGYGFDCVRVVDDLIFDLTPLKITSSDETPYHVNFGSSTFWFNMCQPLHQNSCGNDLAIASMTAADGTCNTVSEIKDVLNYGHWDTFDSDGHRELVLSYDTHDKCDARPDLNYTVHMTFQCDSDIDELTVPEESAAVDDCHFMVYMKTKHACPNYDFSRLIKFFHKYSILFGIALSAVGVFLTFFGRKMFKPTFFLVMTIFITGLTMLMAYEFANVDKDWGWWIILGVGAVVGMLLAGICLCLRKLALFLIGAAGGCVGALVLQNLFLYKIHSHPSNLSLYIALGVLGIAGGIVMIVLVDHMLIITTAFIGAYAFVRGISLFSPHTFPSEWTISKEIHNGTLKEMPWQYYLYFGAFIVTFILGLFVQYRVKNNEKKRETREEDVYDGTNMTTNLV
mmetsp:Transcript_45645/g.52578  ORF Transcript_45645/g.52578 Transcript_45645/m.52578 type:complete len:417 (+) Transcript_45645:56-1306(+)